MKKSIFYKFKQDYRHYICTAAVLMSAAAGHFFPNSIPRLIESVRDLLTSVLYYFVEIFSSSGNMIPPTVLKLQSWSFGAEIWEPVRILPSSLEEFIVFWAEYVKLILNVDNLISFLSSISDILYYSSKLILLFVPLLLLIVIKLHDIKTRSCTVRGKKSKQLINFEYFLNDVVQPIISRIKDLCDFTLAHKFYVKALVLIWGLHLNVFSIVISFLAYYFYLTSSWNIFTVYGQLLKLQKDITPMVRFIPGIIWLVIGYKIYDFICRRLAFKRLRYALRCNEAVIRDRGVVSIIAGKMRMGKTKLATSMALVTEKVIYDDMYDTMLKYERMFPNFPWQIFRDELTRLIYFRDIVDLDSCRKTVQKMGKWFGYISSRYSYFEYQYLLRKFRLQIDRSFGYNYDSYSTFYDNGLSYISLFKALEEYACAYYVFTVKTTLIYSNYSIRSDSSLRSFGNKPFRDNNFINRTPGLRDIYSHYSHVLDMDILRLQTKMIDNNKYGRVLHPGAYVISEIDKERKNMLELKEMKISSDEANQKNDGFNATLMMSGHANLVDYKPIIKFFGDLQRPENLGAGARELGDVIYIVDKSDTMPVLPFFSPYWFTQGIFEVIQSKWTSFKNEYDINRCDGTLFVYLVDNIISKINNHYDKIQGLFGMQMLTLEIESGSLDGERKTEYWRSMSIFDLSERYSSDCLKGVFVSDPPNEKHIDDFVMYEGIMPTPEELAMQHSYFYNGVHSIKKKGK